MARNNSLYNTNTNLYKTPNNKLSQQSFIGVLNPNIQQQTNTNDWYKNNNLSWFPELNQEYSITNPNVGPRFNATDVAAMGTNKFSTPEINKPDMYSQYMSNLDKINRMQNISNIGSALWNVGVLLGEATRRPGQPYVAPKLTTPRLTDPTAAILQKGQEDITSATAGAKRFISETGQYNLVPGLQANELKQRKDLSLQVIPMRSQLLNQQEMMQADIASKQSMIDAETINKNIEKQIRENMASGQTITQAINGLDLISKSYLQRLSDTEYNKFMAGYMKEQQTIEKIKANVPSVV